MLYRTTLVVGPTGLPIRNYLALGRPGFRRLLVDIDLVCGDYVLHLENYVRDRHRRIIRVDWLHEFNLEKLVMCEFGCPVELAREIVIHFERTQLIFCPPIFGAKEALTVLRRWYDPHALTTRSYTLQNVTHAFIGAHFYRLFYAITLCGNPHYPIKEICTNKDSHHETIGADILIDDSPRNVIRCFMAGYDPICFGNYPFYDYSEVERLGIRRARNWLEVVALLMPPHPDL